MPKSLTLVSTPPSKLTNVDDFLMSENRCLKVILGDGNCMFRALSHQLYGSEEYHREIRHLLLEVLKTNPHLYHPYWIEDLPWGKVTFTEHLNQLKCEGTWGTQLELRVFSDCFNLPVYVCSANQFGILRWELKGEPKYHQRINPPFTTRATELPFTRGHVALMYNSGHYNSVVPSRKGTQLLPPLIISRQSDHAVHVE